jgi:exosortase/archaeosortase family protein
VLVLAVPFVPRLLDAALPSSVTWGVIRGTAKAASVLIAAIGVPCRLAEGNRLYLTHHVFRIDAACTAGLWLALYALAVVLMPVSAKRRLLGLLGLPVLLAFNLARLVGVAAVSEWWPRQFYFVHDVVMQAAFLIFTVSLWGLWMWWSRGDWKPGWE